MADPSLSPQARRAFLRLTGSAALTLALAACQVVPKGPAGPTPPPQPGEPAIQLPPEETRNRVAVLAPLTGENGGVGTSIANAANLALLDTGGERIRITVYDTAKAGVAAAANEALAEGNGLILGPLLSEDVRAVAPIARAARIPVIAFSNDVGIAGDGVYVMGFTPDQSIERVVAYAQERGARRFAALIPEGVYGQRASQAMLDAVKRSGGRMVAMQDYSRSPASLRAAIGRLNGQGEYDAVLIADGGRIAAVAAPILRGGPSKAARILGTELWSTDNALGKTAALRGAWFAAPSDTLFGQLATRYRARYGKTPYRLASLGYDAVLLTMRIAANWRLGRPFPAREIESDEGFTGIDGAFRFRPDGTADRMLAVQEVTAGGTNMVSPAPRGFGK
ncbi:MAG TPA: penicillin-binding protein activator [Allosphingosinicella sp.]